MASYLRQTRTQFRRTHWSYGVEVLWGFTDGEHEIRKPKRMWNDDDLEPVQMMDTETKSHCNDACDPRTDEPEVCVLKTV